MNDDDGTVVPFPLDPRQRIANDKEAELDELPARTAQRDYSKPRPCQHRQSIVDDEARTVKCSKCDVPLDPIDVLAKFARQREHLIEAGRMLRNRIDWATRRLGQLEREERNAKSRIRRARSKRGDRTALEAAARAAGSVGGYRPWDDLSEPQQGVVRERMRDAIEAYHGTLDEAESESA